MRDGWWLGLRKEHAKLPSISFMGNQIMPTQTVHKLRIGDSVMNLALRYAAKTNNFEFISTLRNRKLSKARYLGFISSMYPLVVGFNRALIRSIAKIDHVRESTFVKALAEQIREEQEHNELWRQKLDRYGIDHEMLYRDLQDYMAKFSIEALDSMTCEVVACLASDLGNVSPGHFPKPVFPEPVLALYHHMWMTACYDEIDYWEHYAGQYAMETIIYDVVSTSIFPGVENNPELEGGSAAIGWWKEHARQGSVKPGKRNPEEKHLELGRTYLNRSERAHSIHARILSRAEDTARLFAAAAIFHDLDKGYFAIERYLTHRD